MGTKTCARCKVVKAADAFGSNRAMRDGKQPYCRPCASEYQKAWYEAHPERREAHNAASKAREQAARTRAPGWEERDRLKAERVALGDAAWKRRRREMVKERKIHARAARRNAMFDAQGGVCAVCTATEPGGHAGWHLDHAHDCCIGKTLDSCGGCDRGVLCFSCNVHLLPALERLNVDQQNLLVAHPHLSDAETLAGLQYLADYRERRQAAPSV